MSTAPVTRDPAQPSPVATSGPGLFGGATARRDYALTFVTEFGVLASTVLIFRLAAVYWGTTGFGEYVLARRTLSLLELPLLLGMGLAVARYTALSRGSRAGTDTSSHLASALLLVGLSGAAAVVALVLLARPLGFLVFGSAEYAGLVRALAVAVPGMLLHTLAYADLRGRVAMVPGNVLQALNRGLAPLVVFAIPGLMVGEAVTLTGVLWLGLSSVAVARSLSRYPPGDWKLCTLWAGARELTRYGAPRVPGEVALGALFALPAILAAHYGGVAPAGFVALGVSLVNAVGSLFDPVGQIVLPTAAVLFSSGAHDVLRRDVRRLCLIALAGSATILLGLEALAPAVVTWLLGGQFAPAVPVVRAVALGAIPYVMYVVLRNVLDAVHVRPLNAKNLLLGLGAFLALAGVTRSAAAVSVAFALGLSVLGVLTARDAARLLRIGRAWDSRV